MRLASVVEREFSDELTGLMPVVPHGTGGVDCGGGSVAVIDTPLSIAASDRLVVI
jgi:hypothetical protein